MIDFRYHIVSLIAVFLALAVGVVLGAGPLGGTFGEQLTAQVETLRQEKEALRIELEDARADNEDLVTFVDSAAAQLLPGTLTDVGVDRGGDAGRRLRHGDARCRTGSSRPVARSAGTWPRRLGGPTPLTRRYGTRPPPTSGR